MQWMTAGKGIMHSEMPGSFDEVSHGFQAWLNLEQKLKLCEPQYQEIKKNQIAEFNEGGIRAKILAGEVFGVKSMIKTRTPAYYIDFHMDEKKNYKHVIPKNWNSIIVCYEGSMMV